MTKNEFLQRFQINSLSASSHKYKHPSHSKNNPLKQAAVLVPLVDHHDHIKILFTKRASHLRQHGGQICFPGGRVDASDTDLISTATREAFEEISLLPQHCNVIGQLHPYQTISGYIVNPIVALIPADLLLTASVDEVEEIFEVPLEHFLDPANVKSIWVEQPPQRYQVHFMPYNNYNIWGATAAILKDLSDHIR